MSWFCGSSKKRRKTKVSNISSQPSTNTAVLTNGRPSYIVMLQDFAGHASDELSVKRGQALEALYTDKDWIYAKDIVTMTCGYVPQTFCYSLDAMGSGSLQDHASVHPPRPKNLQLDMVPVVNHGSQSSVSVSQTQDRASSQVTSTPASRGVSIATTHDNADGQVTLTPVSRRASVATQQETIDGQVTMTPVSRRASVATQQESVSRQASVPTQQESVEVTPVARRASVATPHDEQVNLRPVTRRASMPNTLDGQINLTPVGRQASVVTRDSSMSQVSTMQQPTHQRTHTSRSQGNLTNELIVATEMSATTDKQSTNSIQTPVSDSTNASLRAKRAQRLSCPPDRELTLESFQYTPYSASRANPVKRSVSMNDGAQARARVRPRALPVNRTLSYREAVSSTVEQIDTTVSLSGDRMRNTFDEPLDTRRLSSNGSPGCTRKNCDCSKRPKPGPNSRKNRLRKQPFVEYDSSDDVFLPNTKQKKPFGIFRCTEDHQPVIEGEVAVRKNELIIVLDYGRKEWAWIITSHHIEGLVPKRLLTRYDSDRGPTGAKMVDESTQTELIVSGDVRQVASSANAGMGTVRQVSTASNASMGTSNARQVSSASSASGPSVCGTLTPPETTPQLAQTATVAQASSKPLTVPSSEWFSFTDSFERSSCTTKLSTPPNTRRLPESAPVTPISPMSRQSHRLSANVDRKKSQSSRTLTNRGTPVLTAAKDYQPPERSKNCLSLKKGDVLTVQSHMHYPKGWMWVWHPEQRRFGYVPNSSIAFNYPVTRSNRTATIEDEV